MRNWKRNWKWKHKRSTNRIGCALAVLAIALGVPQASSAGGHGHHKPRPYGYGYRYTYGYGPRIVIGGFFGPGPWWPRSWSPYYPAGGPTYVSSPPVVVQQAPVYAEPPEESPSYWYYCQSPQGYYPYVPRCSSGWMQVVPPQGPPD